MGGALLVAVAVFGAIVAHNHGPTLFDKWSLSVTNHVLPAGFWKGISKISSPYILGPATALCASFALRRGWRLAITCLISPAVAVLLVEGAKHVFGRLYEGVLSYPSGNVAAVTSVVAVAVLVVPRRYRVVSSVAGALVICAVGVAVVTLRWHYATDAIAGAMVGIAVVEVMEEVTRRISAQRKHPLTQAEPPFVAAFIHAPPPGPSQFVSAREKPPANQPPGDFEPEHGLWPLGNEGETQPSIETGLREIGEPPDAELQVFLEGAGGAGAEIATTEEPVYSQLADPGAQDEAWDPAIEGSVETDRVELVEAPLSEQEAPIGPGALDLAPPIEADWVDMGYPVELGAAEPVPPVERDGVDMGYPEEPDALTVLAAVRAQGTDERADFAAPEPVETAWTDDPGYLELPEVAPSVPSGQEPEGLVRAEDQIRAEMENLRDQLDLLEDLIAEAMSTPSQVVAADVEDGHFLELFARAREWIDDVMSRAREDAANIVATAHVTATDILVAARTTANDILATAREQATEIVAEAIAKSDTLTEQDRRVLPIDPMDLKDLEDSITNFSDANSEVTQDLLSLRDFA